jgi:hypothetical protein
VLFALVSCITTQKANLSIEDLAGTWINEEYDDIASPESAKVVVTADGVLTTYYRIADKKVRSTFEISIVESWYDENGDIWFKSVWERIGALAEVTHTNIYYSINRLSNSGTVWERCDQASDYPTELSQIAGALRIHFRK